MNLRVAVDFGTSSTCVVASMNGREPQVVVIDGQPLLPSAVYAAPDGTLFVGHEAERQAAVDPSRYEPHPKRRIDEGELLLGSSVLLVRDVVNAVLRRAVSEARRFAGGALVDLLVLTHPADWGAVRTRVLRQAAGGLAREVALVPEPVAAAVFHSSTFAPRDSDQQRTVAFNGDPGDVLAVLDLGGGTVDVSVVRRDAAEQGQQAGFSVLATRGDPSFGGADVDQVLLEHVGSLVRDTDPAGWRQLMEGRELADRRRRRVLRQDVRGAKETLSRHAYTDVPMPPPFSDAHVTRADLERLISPQLGRAVDMTVAAIHEAGLRPKQLTGIFLVGGSSRIPLISRLVHERTGIVPTTLDQPETVVSRGAMRAVLNARAARGPAATAGAAMSGAHGVPRGGPGVLNHPGGPGGPPSPPGGLRPPGGPHAAPRTPAHAHQGYGPQSGAFARQTSGVDSPTTRVAAVADPAAAPETGKSDGRGRRKLPWLVGGAVLGVVAVTAGLIVWLGGGTEPEGTARTNTMAQYDYGFEYPASWKHTGGVVEERKVVVRPSDAPEGDNLVSVQEFQLTYSASDEPERLPRELGKLIADSGGKYAQFDADYQFANRNVVFYTEPGQTSAVDWFVIARNRVQISVGCRYTETGVERVREACEQIVRTLRIDG